MVSLSKDGINLLPSSTNSKKTDLSKVNFTVIDIAVSVIFLTLLIWFRYFT